MTLKADSVPLQDLLRDAFAHGITIKIDPDINPLITVDFADKDIQKAFEDLLKGYSHAFIWSDDSSGGQKLSQILIYREGHMDQARKIRSAFRRNLDAIKDPETGAYYVKNRFLLTFSRPVSQNRIQLILKKFNAKIISVHREMGIYAVTVQDAADIRPLLERLDREGFIGGAEPDYAYQAPETRRAMPILENSPSAGQTDPFQVADDSCAVAVLDTGLMAEYAGKDFIKGSFDALSPDSPISMGQSNYGDFVDLSAPGFASLPVGSEGEPGTYAGTSISTAYLAGKLAAFLREHPDAETISPDVLMHSK